MKQWLLAAAICLVFLPVVIQNTALQDQVRLQYMEPLPQDADGKSLYEKQVVSMAADNIQYLHSAALVELSDGSVRAFWYAGEDEGTKDVSIYSSVLNSNNLWSEPTVAISRQQTMSDLNRNIRKLGNPVVVKDNHNKLWLFYVGVSVGGWAGAHINVVTSVDDGTTWSKAQRLISSPFLNISTLVKGAPFLYDDGTIALPVYHEFLDKFGEILRINSEGRVINKTRITAGDSLQPILLQSSENNVLSLLRYGGEDPMRIVQAESGDGGISWQKAYASQLPNPNAAVAGLVLSNGDFLIAFNNSEEDRDDMTLAISNDQGKTWSVIHEIEKKEGTKKNEYQISYPYMLQSSDGMIHVIFSFNNSELRHVRFNQSWLEKIK